jgi:hypothetical protein
VVVAEAAVVEEVVVAAEGEAGEGEAGELVLAAAAEELDLLADHIPEHRIRIVD